MWLHCTEKDNADKNPLSEQYAGTYPNGGDKMAFAFQLHTERMAGNHGTAPDSHKLDQNSELVTTTYEYFCARCHEITNFDARLVCQQCMYQLGS
jgi:hypothetical protein